MPDVLTTSVVVAVAAWLLVYADWVVWSHPGTIAQCPQAREACFFSEHYNGARALFRESSKCAAADSCRAGFVGTLPEGATVEHEALPIDTGADPDLTIDITVIRGKHATSAGPLLVHLSGVHGIEGFCGSAVQTAVLQGYGGTPAAALDNITIVLVHGVNPYGFKHLRRWNEDNIDLNRNLLSREQFAAAVAAGKQPGGREEEAEYRGLRHILAPAHGWRYLVHDAIFYLQMPYLLLAYGRLHIKGAMVSGQYSHPQGIFYGGDALSASHTALFRLLSTRFAQHDPVVMVDVHTGLGPHGVDSLMFGAGQRSHLVRAFGEPPAAPTAGVQGRFLLSDPGSGAESASAGYERAQGMTESYCPFVRRAVVDHAAEAGAEAGPGWRHCLSVTEEFGTVRGEFVAKALVQENMAFHHDQGDPGSIARAKRELRAAFYPSDLDWKRSIVIRGVTVFRQAAHYLSRAPQDVPETAPLADPSVTVL